MRRTVFLVDMNAFFISCETTRRPELRGVPAAVAGDPQRRSGIVLAANYEARAFGVKTTMPLWQAERLCPKLIFVPPDHAFYSRMSRSVMELLGRYTPVLEQNSIDEAWLDMTGGSLLFGEPAVCARRIMNEIGQSLGLWCSIGIAPGKFLAKMASEIKKPLGITELWEKDIPAKLWPLPVDAFYGVGEQTAARLRRMGMRTIGDIAAYGAALPQALGKYGALLYDLARGVDPEPVTPRVRDAMKSIGRSTTLPQDITDFASARRVLMGLTEEVGADARRHGKQGSTVTVTIKYADFSVVTRQAPLPATCLTRDLIAAGAELLRKNWTGRPVRLLGISLSGFEKAESGQLSLFEPPERDTRERQLEQAVDTLRERFGEDAVRRAALLPPSGAEGRSIDLGAKKPPNAPK